MTDPFAAVVFGFLFGVLAGIHAVMLREWRSHHD